MLCKRARVLAGARAGESRDGVWCETVVARDVAQRVDPAGNLMQSTTALQLLSPAGIWREHLL